MAEMVSDVDDWKSLRLEHVVYAYRKAKSDCFFDRTIAMGERFSRYEKNLAENLTGLLGRLQSGDVEHLFQAKPTQVRVVAKKLSLESLSLSEHQKRQGFDEGSPSATELFADSGHAYFSDSNRAFDRLLRHKKVVPEFRVVGDFGVEMHILSALWINFVGEKLDAKLSRSAYGARLRRTRPNPGAPEDEVGAFHFEALGSFQPYFMPYRRWRKNGLDSIRNELKQGRDVVAVSLDLASYYHRVDPTFVDDSRFLVSIGVELSRWERELNSKFASFLSEWAKLAAAKLRELGAPIISEGAGIPIGLAATRIVSNVLLAELDRDVERGLAPVYYGRYVDDIFIVFRDPGDLLEARDVLKYIAERTDSFPQDASNGVVHLHLKGNYQGNSVLALQSGKQKTFFLAAQSGLDLLDSIEAQIRSVSSERRLMPSPRNLSTMASAKVLSAGGDAAEEADTLRRADGLSVRRLSWALQLRAVEVLARDLRQEDWADERREFYRFSRSHILRPDKILDHFDYFPRLLSLAVGLTDWAEARRLYDAAKSAIAELQDRSRDGTRINGLECASTLGVWEALNRTFEDLAREAIVASVRWDTRTASPHRLPKTALDLCNELGVGTPTELVDRALNLREIDWARTPYKQHLKLAAARHRPQSVGEDEITAAFRWAADIREFIQATQVSPTSIVMPRVRAELMGVAPLSGSLLPYVFPTRPYSTQEISALLPELCVIGDAGECANNWARFTRALRGVWVWGENGTEIVTHARSRSVREISCHDKIAYLGNAGREAPVRLGISNLRTEDGSWEAAASGRADLGPARYERLRQIVNQAVVASPRPTYLLLPELSVPERWIGTISSTLADAGVGLIAGVDYQTPKKREIHSSAVIVVSDNRLGYPAAVEIRQVKCLPAPGEDKDLQHRFGRTWTPLDAPKPVYIHDDFAFGVLICSELQNVGHRLEFQGDVDCLMVLSWNQDIETFSALVESASLDVHASIALVNNSRFGDSRVRVPAKKSFRRDVCRLRGGENEHVVVVSVDVNALRAFQSRAHRWPSDNDPYKPVPEAFEIAPFRRTLPK